MKFWPRSFPVALSKREKKPMSSQRFYSARQGIIGDTVRQHGRFSRLLVIRSFLTVPTYRVLATLRLCQGVAECGKVAKLLMPFAILVHKLATKSAAIDLSWETKIAPGMKFTHGFGAVLSPGARIGSNCTLFHGATLGRGDRIRSDGERVMGYPVLEDEVWVGPHAVIVGAITIGKGSRLLANTFVTNDIPAGSIVSGNPAQIIKENAPPDVFNPFRSLS